MIILFKTLNQRLLPHLILILGLSFVAGGCALTRKPSAEELRALDQPPVAVKAKIEKYSSRTLSWYRKVEAEFLSQGRPLTKCEEETAVKLGVKNVGKVRVVVMSKLPMPDDPELRAEAERFGMGSFFEGGRTIGHVIMLKPKLADRAEAVTHELVHVGQVERMGDEGFLRRYFAEMMMLGYLRSPLEAEAYEKQKKFKKMKN